MRGAPGRSLATGWVALLAACCLARGAAAGNGAFTIRHEKTSKCLQVKNSQIMAADCKETNETLWKWVSQNRLFHLGSRQCLGLNIAKPASPLKMVNCDSQLMLWWRCVDASVFGASQYKLTLKDNVVTASINSSDAWRRSNSSDDICEYPYREIYTRDGNSYGRPCEFPFLVNKTWYHDCIRDETHTDGDWCATTSSYNQDAKWGICLKPEDGCRDTWEHDPGSESCYQLNTQSALSWKEAYISCQTQGGDLLSITNTSELSYIQAKDGIAEVFWIGLNQLDISGGWQWSDHTPLNFLNWNPVSDDDPAMFVLRTLFTADLTKRKDGTNVRFLKIAIALDPRFKNLKCCPKYERDEVWGMLLEVSKEQHSDAETTELKPPTKKINSWWLLTQMMKMNMHQSALL